MHLRQTDVLIKPRRCFKTSLQALAYRDRAGKDHEALRHAY